MHWFWRVLILGCLGATLLTAMIGMVSCGQTLLCGKLSPASPFQVSFRNNPNSLTCPGFSFRNGSVVWYSKNRSQAQQSPFGLGMINKNWCGFGVFYVPTALGRNGILRIWFPLWLPFLAFSAYPAIAFIRGPYRRYRRHRKGLCLKCGYNLTGNASGVCPECVERI